MSEITLILKNKDGLGCFAPAARASPYCDSPVLPNLTLRFEFFLLTRYFLRDILFGRKKVGGTK
jgi:hypothetical protein